MKAYDPAITATPIAVDTYSTGASIATAEGSIDTCGSNGGLTCKTGMCCSSHG